MDDGWRTMAVECPATDALWLKPRAEKKQSPLRGLRSVRVVSEGDFATCQPANSLAGHTHGASTLSLPSHRPSPTLMSNITLRRMRQ